MTTDNPETALAATRGELAARDETGEPRGWRRRMAGALSLLTPGVLAVAVGSVTASLPAAAATIGVGAALHRTWRRGYEWLFRARKGDDEELRTAMTKRHIGTGVFATAATAFLPVLGLEILFELGLRGAAMFVAALGATFVLPVPLFDGVRRLSNAGLREVLGDSDVRGLLGTGDTRLLGVAVDVGSTVRAPLSGGACLAASLVAVDATGAELGRWTAASELGLKVGDNLFVLDGHMSVTGDNCEYAIPAAGARVDAEAARLVQAHPTAELREFVLREGDRVEARGPALTTEQHRAFTTDYRALGDGPVMRGRKDAAVTVTRVVAPAS